MLQQRPQLKLFPLRDLDQLQVAGRAQNRQHAALELGQDDPVEAVLGGRDLAGGPGERSR